MITWAVYEAMTTWADDKPLVIIDTLGKVLPPELRGETPYMRDYRVTADLKALADNCGGSGVLITHHDRKASAADFIDAVSGTHGIAGAADAVLLLTRPRLESEGLIQITGRDVDEAEYAMTFSGGRWTPEGGDLSAAAVYAQARRLKTGLGDTSSEVLALVSERGTRGTQAADVATALDMTPHDARTYLGRLADAGRIWKPKRGIYAPAGVAYDANAVQADGVASVASVASEDSARSEGVCSEETQVSEGLQENATHATDATPFAAQGTGGPPPMDEEILREVMAGVAKPADARPPVPGSPEHPWDTCPDCEAARKIRRKKARQARDAGESVKSIAARLGVRTTVVYDDLKAP